MPASLCRLQPRPAFLALLAPLWLVLTAPASGAGAVPVPLFSNQATGPVAAPWHFATLPRKTLTVFSITPLDGVQVLRVATDDGYGNLVLTLPAGSPAPALLAWRWRVDQLVAQADLRQRAGDDTALKLCISFAFDKARLGWNERTKLRLAQLSTGESIPAETLCYVWDNQLPVGTLLPNAFTGRIRQIVLQSGATHLGQWMHEQRDLAADYARAFGEESPRMPAVQAIAIAADADNTHGSGLGYVGDITLGETSPAAPAPP